MRLRIIQLVLILFLAYSCEKRTETPPPDPTFPEGTLTIIDPADSSFFPAQQKVEIHAIVKGKSEDYSFLKGYVYTTNEENWTIDTLSTTNVAQDGSITYTLPDTLSPGLYTFHLVVNNPFNRDEHAGKDITLYIGQPPPVEITLLEKDDTSIVIHWTKSTVANFEAYEIYTDVTENLADRYPMPSTLIARITDRDQLSFRHDSVDIYYRYGYVVKVITSQHVSSTSAMKQIDAGTFIDIGGTNNIVNDPGRKRIYLPNGASIKIINPATLTFENAVTMPHEVHYLNMISPDNLDCIFKLGPNDFQAATIDLNNWQVTLKEQFSLPTAAYSPGISIAAYMNSTAFFSENPPGPPFTSSVIAYNISNGNKQVIADVDLPVIKVLSDNRLIVTSFSDSFLVFRQNADVFTRIANVPLQEMATKIDESADYISVGNQVFDQSFNLVHQLPPRESNFNWILGFSDDGKYAVSAENKIINTTTWSVIRTYGGGTGLRVYFSADNKTLYHISVAGLNPRWQPPTRLHRFPWTH